MAMTAVAVRDNIQAQNTTPISSPHQPRYTSLSHMSQYQMVCDSIDVLGEDPKSLLPMENSEWEDIERCNNFNIRIHGYTVRCIVTNSAGMQTISEEYSRSHYCSIQRKDIVYVIMIMWYNPPNKDKGHRYATFIPTSL